MDGLRSKLKEGPSVGTPVARSESSDPRRARAHDRDPGPRNAPAHRAEGLPCHREEGAIMGIGRCAHQPVSVRESRQRRRASAQGFQDRSFGSASSPLPNGGSRLPSAVVTNDQEGVTPLNALTGSRTGAGGVALPTAGERVKCRGSHRERAKPRRPATFVSSRPSRGLEEGSTNARFPSPASAVRQVCIRESPPGRPVASGDPQCRYCCRLPVRQPTGLPNHRRPPSGKPPTRFLSGGDDSAPEPGHPPTRITETVAWMLGVQEGW
jgi:hypothetical protein